MPMHSESYPAARFIKESGQAALPTPVFPEACSENSSGPVRFSLQYRH